MSLQRARICDVRLTAPPLSQGCHSMAKPRASARATHLQRVWVSWPKAAVLLVLLALPVSHSARSVFISPGDGRAFAQAVADYGSTGEDTTILLAPGRVLSVANVTFPDAVPVSPKRALAASCTPAQPCCARGAQALSSTTRLQAANAHCLSVMPTDYVQVDPSFVPFSSGRLTIMPAPYNGTDTGPTILDADMRYGLPTFGKSAPLTNS